MKTDKRKIKERQKVKKKKKDEKGEKNRRKTPGKRERKTIETWEKKRKICKRERR